MLFNNFVSKIFAFPFLKLNLSIVLQNQFEITSSPEINSFQTATIGRPRTRPKDVTFSTFATIRRDHIITDSIPGPESCV